MFDFLGYMWAPIIGGILQILILIMGFFGAYQYRPKVLIVVSKPWVIFVVDKYGSGHGGMAVFVTWFWYQLIAKPVNKTVASS